MDGYGTHPLLEQWRGQIVPRSVQPGFVALSYVVSLIGAAATLELINRRTSPKGKFNHLLLVGAAITMGGIAIWCMHYIGNRAIDMAGGELELQIAYSSGFTALSFFVPILVLLTAFIAIGTSSDVSWWRVAAGGTLAGGAICGMHYLGNASISNYTCIYNYVNVAASVLIAVAASITALALFFVFRASWTNSWWKRAASAILLAGAVSGMHWCALTGTRYKLVGLNNMLNQTSRNTTIIIVICLSIATLIVMAGMFIYTARVLSRYASKAQQVVLATAIFDKQGRVLVSPEGLLPSEKITDSFLEKTPQDTFSIAHPLFQWMFQASRNWSNLGSVVNVMIDHLARLPHSGRDLSRNGIKLVDERGELIENYDIIFKELFCAAARALAEKTKSNLTEVGILWDEIIPTGTGGDIRRPQHQGGRKRTIRPNSGDTSDETLAEKGQAQRRIQELYRGSLMFLVRRVETSRETTDLEAAGYRFADVSQVSGIISSSMQIKSHNIENKLNNMARYAQQENSRLSPGVHLGFFAVRAKIGRHGFDVLVPSATKHLLPSVQMPIASLNAWQTNLLRQFDGLTPSQIARHLDGQKHLSHSEYGFASQFENSMAMLRSQIEDDIFEEATFTCKVVQVPCRPSTASGSADTCRLITFKLVVPIHQHVKCLGLEFIPLSLFKVHQLVYRDSPYNLIFSRSVHREISPILNAIPVSNLQLTRSGSGPNDLPHYTPDHLRARDKLRRLGHKIFNKKSGTPTAVDVDGNPIPVVFGHQRTPGQMETASNNSSSTLKLWNPHSSQNRHGSNAHQPDRDDLTHHNTPKQSSTFDVAEMQPFASGPRSPDSDETTLGIGSILSKQMSNSNQANAHGNPWGGIYVSQEITVDVQQVEAGVAVEGIRKKSVSCTSSAPAIAAAGAKGHGGGESDNNIEMQNWGSKAGVTVQAESLGNETTTFVDELFAVCVEHR